MNIVLMAGGGGTRLWPLSRQRVPKQFLDLGRGRTLIEEAYQRAVQLAGAEHVYVATSAAYQQQVARLLPQIPAARVFLEPEKRDTTAAFASVAIRLAQLGEGEVPAIFMWSDHVFTEEAAFLADLRKIPQLLAANPQHLIIMGHAPLSPDTTLGYIEAGELLPGEDHVYHVAAFREKPDQVVAEQYVVSGKHFWNLGYFSLQPAYLIAELLRLNPDMSEAVAAYQAAIGRGDEALAARAYSAFPQQALEYTVIEKTPRILAVTGDYGWSDVGNWAAVKKIFGAGGDHVPRGHHLHISGSNNYIYNATGKTVTMLGMADTIVVVTDDAILVTNVDHAPQVKDVVSSLAADNKTDVL